MSQPSKLKMNVYDFCLVGQAQMSGLVGGAPKTLCVSVLLICVQGLVRRQCGALTRSRPVYLENEGQDPSIRNTRSRPAYLNT